MTVQWLFESGMIAWVLLIVGAALVLAIEWRNRKGRK